jgi:hypothetical protein
MLIPGAALALESGALWLPDLALAEDAPKAEVSGWTVHVVEDELEAALWVAFVFDGAELFALLCAGASGMHRAHRSAHVELLRTHFVLIPETS